MLVAVDVTYTGSTNTKLPNFEPVRVLFGPVTGLVKEFTTERREDGGNVVNFLHRRGKDPRTGRPLRAARKAELLF